MDIHRKSFIGVELKADKPGSFTARIATLNVIDRDGDVTLPGAFPQGKGILISAYQHGSWQGALPVGKGVIHEVGDSVIVEGSFNLSTDTGKEHYETIKFSPELTEWSYGFVIKALDEESPWNDNPKVWRVFKSLDVFEASPVLRGAGENTATLAIKTDKDGTSYADHSDAVLAAVTEWTGRTKALAALRKQEGRELSAANRERLSALLKSLADLSGDLKTLLEPPKNEAQKLYLEYLRTESKLREVLN